MASREKEELFGIEKEQKEDERTGNALLLLGINQDVKGVCTISESFAHELFEDEAALLWVAPETARDPMMQNNSDDVNKTDKNGHTPLYVASEKGCAQSVALFLQHSGIDVNKSDKYDYTPLYVASEKGRDRVVALLVKHGMIDINKPDIWGRTSLYVASENGFPRVAALLLKYGSIDVNKAQIWGRTPLFIASMYSFAPVVARLLKNGALVNKADHNEQTPLFVASMWGRIKCVNLLLSGGADLHTGDGRTPRQVACLGYRARLANRQPVIDSIDRWPVTMTILCFKELGFFHWVDLSMIDLWQFIGLEDDFLFEL